MATKRKEALRSSMDVGQASNVKGDGLLVIYNNHPNWQYIPLMDMPGIYIYMYVYIAS